MLHAIRQFWRKTRHITWIGIRSGLWVLFFVVLTGALGSGHESDTSLHGQVIDIVRNDLFNYAAWEVEALWGKTKQELFGVQPYLDDGEQKPLVIDYLRRVGQLQQLEYQIEIVYANPDISDPAAASADLRAQRDTLQRDLAQDQPLVESIIEAQVSAVLIDEGFGTLGQVLPPVSMHFTEIPMALIVSPRQRIETVVNLDLNPLNIEQRSTYESEIDHSLDVSSLTVRLGGLSLYPSMIEETSDIAWAYEVTAHEWSHHYLMFYPLGLEYGVQPETRIINETAASFFGQAVAAKVLARYYPELPQPVYNSFLAPPPPPDLSGDPDAPPPFDFGSELNTTRVTVDWLLSMGWVDGAETYMEYRRREFVRQGYNIRKLNQAYFAFYGGYQGEPGAGGEDPIGPSIEELLTLSPDLQTFLSTMRGITTRDQLLAAVERAKN